MRVHANWEARIPSGVWEHLQGQLYFSDAEFIESRGEKIATKLSVDAEIPRLQRRAKASPLGSFVEMPDQKAALVQAHATGCFGMKEIALAFDVHCAAVSRAINKKQGGKV